MTTLMTKELSLNEDFINLNLLDIYQWVWKA